MGVTGDAERLRRGEHFALPKQDTALGNLLLTLLHQAGIPVE